MISALINRALFPANNHPHLLLFLQIHVGIREMGLEGNKEVSYTSMGTCVKIPRNHVNPEGGTCPCTPSTCRWESQCRARHISEAHGQTVKLAESDSSFNERHCLKK